jgi:hypothetical protein
MKATYEKGTYCEALYIVNKGNTVTLNSALTLLIGLSDRRACTWPQASGASGKCMVRRKDSRQ